MSRANYPNRNALRDANDIYLDTVRSFIVHCLKQVQGEAVEYLVEKTLRDEQADKFWRILDETDDIESAIDFSYFPLIIQGQWEAAFGKRFNWDKTVQSMLWLIREGRNSCEHRTTKDLDAEFVRVNLFHIADVLGKINRPDKQHEVEVIRDELFSDDTEEHLEKAEKRLKDLESEKSEAEKCLADVESKKKEYAEKNAALSKQVDEKENQRKKLDKQLKRAKTQNDKYKKDIAGTKQCLKESEAAQIDYKNRLDATSKELKGTQAKWKETEERLATALNQLAAVQTREKGIAARLRAVQNLFTVAAIGEQEVQEVFQSVYPPIKTDSTVRILDRRGVDKKNYLLELLEQKQPTIIYVQSEERIDQLLTFVGPEKADIIGKCNEQTSEAEETEILEKLGNGELIAVVSDTTLSALTSSHCIEHFVFCHLVPSLDEFFNQCEQAFTPEKNAYLHLIYNKEQDVEGLDQWLTQKYPDEEALGALYRELRRLAETDESFIKPENVCNENIYNKLGMTKLGVETGLAIFEELQFLERIERGVKVLPDPEKRGLDESKIHCGGEALKQGIADAQAFQLKRSIEQIWKGLEEKLNVGSEQKLYEGNVDKANFRISETGDDPQSTEVVENDSAADEEPSQASKPAQLAEQDSEKKPEVKQSEFWQPIRDGEFGELFTGKPVPISNEGWITKTVRNIGVCLYLTNQRCYVQIYFHGASGSERREKIMTLFPKSEYAYAYRDSPRETKVQFPVLDKGRKDQDDWDEIRGKLVAMGTDIYTKIDESAL